MNGPAHLSSPNIYLEETSEQNASNSNEEPVVNQQEFDTVMVRLSGIYHDQKTTDQQRKELYRTLIDYPAAAIERAVDVWVDKSEWYPKPANLLELVDRSPSLATAPCGVCEGSGWIETTAPALDDAGHKAAGREGPWVYKCKVCAGSGRGSSRSAV